MIKFDVFNRFSGDVQFTAEIDASEDASRSVKLGLAVKWAVKTGANLEGSSLNGASLRGANLYRSNLEGANLRGADLNGANLYRSNLEGSSLNGASLRGANLRGANLNGSNLRGADLNGANLRGADLNRADLRGADLNRADLNRADLEGANLEGASGVNCYIKCIQIDQYPITYTDTILQIGCQRHEINEWADFDDHRIAEMDGKSALKFWRKYKAWIFQTIELCPAKPTEGAT